MTRLDDHDADDLYPYSCANVVVCTIPDACIQRCRVCVLCVCITLVMRIQCARVYVYTQAQQGHKLLHDEVSFVLGKLYSVDADLMEMRQDMTKVCSACTDTYTHTFQYSMCRYLFIGRGTDIEYSCGGFRTHPFRPSATAQHAPSNTMIMVYPTHSVIALSACPVSITEG